MDLSTAHKYFESLWWNSRGFQFKAQLLMAPSQPSAVYFYLPRRLLKYSYNAGVLPGDYITSKTSGKAYLCGENGDSEFQGQVIYRTLRLFEVTHTSATWKRNDTTKDPITGLAKKNANQPHLVANIPVAIEFVKLQEDEMRIPADLVRIIAKDPIKIGDFINDEYTIVNVEAQLGLYMATAKRQ